MNDCMSIIYCFQFSLAYHAYKHKYTILNSISFNFTHPHSIKSIFNVSESKNEWKNDDDKWNESKLGAQIAYTHIHIIRLEHGTQHIQLSVSCIMNDFGWFECKLHVCQVCLCWVRVILWYISVWFGKILGKTTNENAIISSRHALNVCAWIKIYIETNQKIKC